MFFRWRTFPGIFSEIKWTSISIRCKKMNFFSWINERFFFSFLFFFFSDLLSCPRSTWKMLLNRPLKHLTPTELLIFVHTNYMNLSWILFYQIALWGRFYFLYSFNRIGSSPWHLDLNHDHTIQIDYQVVLQWNKIK